jgi:uncharacterized circularly permuted ATP-grasp superfamily protein
MNKEETIPEIIDIILEKEIPYNVQNVIKSYSETAVKRMMKSLAAEVIKKVQTWHIMNGTFEHTIDEFELSDMLKQLAKECS